MRFGWYGGVIWKDEIMVEHTVRKENRMVSITCPLAECAYNGRKYKCRAKAINLQYRNMATVNEGRVDMWICDKYELSESAKRIQKFFEENPKWK